MESPDLIAALEAVVEEAKTTQQKLNEGAATSGATGLYRIRTLASDALLDARDREEQAAA